MPKPQRANLKNRNERDHRPTERAVTRRPGLWSLALGGLLLALALTASLGLVRQHLTGVKLPGCGGSGEGGEGGAESACASLEAHPFGSLGGFRHGLGVWLGGGGSGTADGGASATFMEFVRGEGAAKVSPDKAVFPTSMLASAFFAAMLVGWLVWSLRATRAADPASAGAGLRGVAGLRTLARLGAAASGVYLVVIVLANKPCPYCLAAHAANLSWWALVEWMAMKHARSTNAKTDALRAARVNWAPMASATAVFLLSAGVLGALDAGKRRDALAKSESALADSQRQLLASAGRAAEQPQAPARPFGERGFTGRWRLGPEEAVARIVLISDYQCPQCRRMENEALALVQKHAGKVSLSAKQHPNGKACNKYYTAATDVHPNACWAARAAEAAAIVAGANAALEGKDQWTAANDAFWKMHQWLFSRGGSFTDASFPVDLAALGFDAQQVIRVMQGPQTLKLIQDDIEEAQSLGINGTPMVLINGVELKGWEAPRALERAVEALLESGASARTARDDAPPRASEKYVADWRDQPVRPMPPDAVERSMGPKDAPVQVVVFGDFQEPNTAKVDALVRGWIDGNIRPVRYVFRHFPGDNTCNQRVSRVFFQHGCLTARAAEAAGVVGGEQGYWAMHAWLLQNQANMSVEAVRRGAAAVGLNADAVVQAMNSPAVEQAIQDDIAAAARLNVGQIPCVYVNGKFVPRWSREGDDVMGRIVEEAAKAK
ncbi:MAG: thioredoxin domain-containing protein [Phycisphaeraceae bacterium]|nr:thioredoxin domain-containing protein [Phycisphaeraceae bacterium]